MESAGSGAADGGRRGMQSPVWRQQTRAAGLAWEAGGFHPPATRENRNLGNNRVQYDRSDTIQEAKEKGT